MGTIMITDNGSMMASYWAASTRNTNATASTNTSIPVLPASFSWKAISVHSKLMPAGRRAFARRSIAANAWADE